MSSCCSKKTNWYDVRENKKRNEILCWGIQSDAPLKKLETRKKRKGKPFFMGNVRQRGMRLKAAIIQTRSPKKKEAERERQE